MSTKQYMPAREIRKHFSVTCQTLRRWANTGRITCLRSGGGPARQGPRLYAFQDVAAIFDAPADVGQPTRQVYAYARVSSAKQRTSGDLQRQIDTLKEAEPDAIIIQDVASGLNWKRKGFIRLLDAVHDRKVSRVVVTYKDRLARFGIDLLKWLFSKTGTELVVLGQNMAEDTKNDDVASTELAEDLLAIVAVFAAKNHGRRGGKRKHTAAKAKEGTQDGRQRKKGKRTHKVAQVPPLSEQDATRDAQ